MDPITRERPARYVAILEKIIGMIESHDYGPGSQLPTEAELCAEFGVSRTTVRHALQHLEFQGLIERKRGKGTFVNIQKIRGWATPTESFTEQVQSHGLSSHSKVLDVRVIPATYKLAQTLLVSEKDPIIQLVRLRFANDQALQHVTSFIPWHIAPGLVEDDCTRSLFALLENKYNVSIHHAVEFIEPMITSSSISSLLNVPNGSPAFLLESITYDHKNVPIEYAKQVIRGDRFRFSTERTYARTLQNSEE